MSPGNVLPRGLARRPEWRSCFRLRRLRESLAIEPPPRIWWAGVRSTRVRTRPSHVQRRRWGKPSQDGHRCAPPSARELDVLSLSDRLAGVNSPLRRSVVRFIGRYTSRVFTRRPWVRATPESGRPQSPQARVPASRASRVSLRVRRAGYHAWLASRPAVGRRRTLRSSRATPSFSGRWLSWTRLCYACERAGWHGDRRREERR